jgi:hypothetical protein
MNSLAINKQTTREVAEVSNPVASAHERFLPHSDIVLKALRLSRARLDGKARIAISAPLLKFLLEELIASLPFDEAYYLEANPDIAASFKDGNILDLHQHFVSAGYFEGRWGAEPQFDETFYLATYPDVAEGIASRKVKSAADHYRSPGASEGRLPSAKVAAVLEKWEAFSREPEPTM